LPNKNTHKASEIIHRLRELSGVQTDKELSIFLGLSANAISNWKNRGAVDLDRVFEKFPEVSPSYIYHGDLPVKREGIQNSTQNESNTYPLEPLSTEIIADAAASYGGETSAEVVIRLKAQVEMLRELIQAKDQHLEDIRDMMRLYEHMLATAGDEGE